jgi:hypothetical protein
MCLQLCNHDTGRPWLWSGSWSVSCPWPRGCFS